MKDVQFSELFYILEMQMRDWEPTPEGETAFKELHVAVE